MAERVGARLIVLHSGCVEMKDYNEKLEEMVEAGLRESPKYFKLVQEVDEKREKKKAGPMALALDMIRRLAEVAGERGIGAKASPRPGRRSYALHVVV